MTRTDALRIVEERISLCTRCPELVASRTTTVPGEGNPAADLMFIGEGPGQKEDEQGKPFVGPAGKLLGSILKACGLRREDVFITNVVKCRPPGNRVPEQEEADNCSRYLKLQIKIVCPKVIVCLGATAASRLLHRDVAISSIRGTWQDYEGIPVMPTFHPAYLLRIEELERQREMKGLVWSDMKQVLKRIAQGGEETCAT